MALCWKARERESIRRKWWYFLNLSLLILWSVHTMRCFLTYNKFIVSTFYIGVFKKTCGILVLFPGKLIPLVWFSGLLLCRLRTMDSSDSHHSATPAAVLVTSVAGEALAHILIPHTKIRFCSHFTSTTKPLRCVDAAIQMMFIQFMT